MERLVRGFTTATRWLHYVSGVLILSMMLMTVGNILGRWLFNRPVRGTIELTEIGMVAIVFLGLSYAQVREDHIRVDLLYNALGRLGRRILGLFAATVSFLTILVMTWRLFDYSGVVQGSGRTTSSLAIPLYPVVWIAVAGSAVYLLGIVVTALYRARGNPDAASLDAESDLDAPGAVSSDDHADTPLDVDDERGSDGAPDNGR